MILPFRESANKKIFSIIDNPYRVYLLYGEADIGKHLVSRYIASKLLDDSSVIKPKYAHPNLFIISNDNQNKDISISQVKDLIDKIWNTGSGVVHQKVIIIQGVDKITPTAANALLKNLEDMPKNTTILLSANSLENVIPTIRSRSQLIYCLADRIRATDYMVANFGCNRQTAEQLLDNSNNRLMGAIRNIESDNFDKTLYIKQMANIFLEDNITRRFIIAKQISEKKLTDLFIEELIYATRQQSTILYDSLDSIETMVRGLDQIRNNVNARIVLENIALR